MSQISAFDSLGPIMIGPSSSHTAGAVKIGLIANKIAKNNIKSVKFYLHGSFAKTYKGHGTDKALIGGILGINEQDSRLKSSKKIAKDLNVTYEFIEKDLGEVHPNTVLIEITSYNTEITSIQGSSIGGGAIIITKLNGLNMKFSGEKPTIITRHKDIPGVVSKVSAIIADLNLNISSMTVSRNEITREASMIIEIDGKYNRIIKSKLLSEIKPLTEVYLF